MWHHYGELLHMDILIRGLDSQAVEAAKKLAASRKRSLNQELVILINSHFLGRLNNARVLSQLDDKNREILARRGELLSDSTDIIKADRAAH
jgi:hypothetical protein